MLISLSGLPGAGKTTVARELARQIGAVHVEIDTIERAIRKSGLPCPDNNAYEAAYQVAHALAGDNLRLGWIVIADCVNPHAYSRDGWSKVAKAASVSLVEVEIICSDVAEHQRRLGSGAQPAGATNPPRWQQVTQNYQAWNRDRLVIETAHQDVASVTTLRRAIPAASRP